jgi:predicted GTPase
MEAEFQIEQAPVERHGHVRVFRDAVHTVVQVVERTAWALEALYRGVIVHRDYEVVAVPTGFPEKPSVPRVEEVKDALAKADSTRTD